MINYLMTKNCADKIMNHNKYSTDCLNKTRSLKVAKHPQLPDFGVSNQPVHNRCQRNYCCQLEYDTFFILLLKTDCGTIKYFDLNNLVLE
jgi:hypothetical protein